MSLRLATDTWKQVAALAILVGGAIACLGLANNEVIAAMFAGAAANHVGLGVRHHTEEMKERRAKRDSGNIMRKENNNG